MKTLKKLTLLAAFALLLSPAGAQELEKKVQSFRKITVSPKINLILQKGDEESVRITYSQIDPEEINVRVSGNRLMIYLEHARFVEKEKRMQDDYYHHSESMYEGATVNAYVTYRELTKVEIRGDQELTCNSDIDGEKFKLKAYGENEIRFKSVSAKTFKTALYGENKLKINGGQAGHQVYRVFGENRVDALALVSQTASTKVYGDGRIRLSAFDGVRITAFGEPRIDVAGTTRISKGIILGNADIRFRVN